MLRGFSILNTQYFVLFTAYLILTSCNSQKPNQTSNDRLYKKDNNDLNAKYLVYHINDTVSNLFYDISNETIVYKKTDTSTFFYSDIKLVAEISDENNLSKVLDTATIYIRDKQSNVDVKQLKGLLNLRLRATKNYHLSITVFDANKKTKYASSIYADKTSNITRQNFLVTDNTSANASRVHSINSATTSAYGSVTNNNIHYTAYYKPNETVAISSERYKETLLTIDYFKPHFKIAVPPFSADQTQRFNYKPDSAFSISVDFDSAQSPSRKAILNLPSVGFYHLKTNDDTKEGVTFFVYEPTFPKIKNAEQMILATRYIMAKKEFDNCMNALDKKQAIDNFWLEISGNNERARELIKKYYGRVQEANKLFTSYQEGWKTDRGMIYIVFGAPNTVTKRKYGEMWTYGESGNTNSIYFQFTKVINPFTDNDFTLERSETFKLPWYQAVDLWRQGRVYIDN